MNALGIYSQDGDKLTSMDFRWTLPQVCKFALVGACDIDSGNAAKMRCAQLLGSA